MAVFHNVLDQTIRRMNLKQIWVAEASGISSARLSLIRRNKEKPTAAETAKLEYYFDMPIERLLAPAMQKMDTSEALNEFTDRIKRK